MIEVGRRSKLLAVPLFPTGRNANCIMSGRHHDRYAKPIKTYF